jgi:hypothetical protein
VAWVIRQCDPGSLQPSDACAGECSFFVQDNHGVLARDVPFHQPLHCRQLHVALSPDFILNKSCTYLVNLICQ